MDFTGVTILCVGDVMLDRFVYGQIDRISPEAPIPVIRLTETREMLGGAGNVAHNIAALGGRAMLVGLVGEDAGADSLRCLLADIPGIELGLVATAHRHTICKTRFIAANQQIVRADEESALPLQPLEQDALLAAIHARMAAAQALLLSDYGKAGLSEAVVTAAIEAARARGIPVFVDPKSENFAHYRGATCITPNAKELAVASRMPSGTAVAATAAARVLLTQMGVQGGAGAILVTRSEHGMLLVQSDGQVNAVPARAREVFDVSGAGDTVIAALTLAHAAGLPLVRAMHVANAAAGVVVSKCGTATATVDEVLHEMGGLAGVGLPGLVDTVQGLAMVARWRAQGLTIGFTNGCFDILHPGHVALLKAARAVCDRLVVALNTDASVQVLKGPERPVNDLACRSRVIAAIRYVDCVLAFADPTPLALIEAVLPDVLVKGADYTEEQVVGAAAVRAAGGRVVLAELTPGQSTTRIVARVRAMAG